MPGPRAFKDGASHPLAGHDDAHVSLRRQFLGFGDPAVDAAGQAHLFANIMRRLFVELGDLREMENAEVVELLFDRRRHTG